MLTKFIGRSRMNLKATDINNIQDFVEDTIQKEVGDFVLTSGLMYKGFLCEEYTATTLRVYDGRLYNGTTPKIYQKETTNGYVDYSLSSYLPAATNKIIGVAISGSTIDTESEARDFVIDIATGETEPQSVATLRENIVTVTLVAGSEAETPAAPDVPAGSIFVALVTLDINGITSIDMQTQNEIPSIGSVNAYVTLLNAFMAATQGQLLSLAADINLLSNIIKNLSTQASYYALVQSVLDIENRLNIKSTHTAYGVDYFIDDTNACDGVGGYNARVDNGVTFDDATVANYDVSLLNPSDPLVTTHADGLVLPKYSASVDKFLNGTALTIFSSALYPSVLDNYKQDTFALDVIRYGSDHNRDINWWAKQYNRKRVYEDGWRYNVGDVNSYEDNIFSLEAAGSGTDRTGSTFAETFKPGSSFWFTGVTIFLSSAPAGTIYFYLCRIDNNGKPNPDRVISAGSTSGGVAGSRTITMDVRHLVAGETYALVIVSASENLFKNASGTFTGAMYYQDASNIWQSEPNNQHLWFAIRAAQFDNTAITVTLNTITLANVDQIKFTAPIITPQDTVANIQIQKSGVWYSINDPAATNILDASVTTVPLRIQLEGTQFNMPGFVETSGSSGIEMTTDDVALAYWHGEGGTDKIDLGASKTDVRVKLIVTNFDTVNDTIVCEIDDGSSQYAADDTTPTPRLIDANTDTYELIYSFTTSISGGVQNIYFKITGTTPSTQPLSPYVINELFYSS